MLKKLLCWTLSFCLVASPVGAAQNPSAAEVAKAQRKLWQDFSSQFQLHRDDLTIADLIRSGRNLVSDSEWQELQAFLRDQGHLKIGTVQVREAKAEASAFELFLQLKGQSASMRAEGSGPNLRVNISGQHRGKSWQQQITPEFENTSFLELFAQLQNPTQPWQPSRAGGRDPASVRSAAVAKDGSGARLLNYEELRRLSPQGRRYYFENLHGIAAVIEKLQESRGIKNASPAGGTQKINPKGKQGANLNGRARDSSLALSAATESLVQQSIWTLLASGPWIPTAHANDSRILGICAGFQTSVERGRPSCDGVAVGTATAESMRERSRIDTGFVECNPSLFGSDGGRPLTIPATPSPQQPIPGGPEARRFLFPADATKRCIDKFNSDLTRNLNPERFRQLRGSDQSTEKIQSFQNMIQDYRRHCEGVLETPENIRTRVRQRLPIVAPVTPQASCRDLLAHLRNLSPDCDSTTGNSPQQNFSRAICPAPGAPLSISEAEQRVINAAGTASARPGRQVRPPPSRTSAPSSPSRPAADAGRAGSGTSSATPGGTSAADGAAGSSPSAAVSPNPAATPPPARPAPAPSPASQPAVAATPETPARPATVQSSTPTTPANRPASPPPAPPTRACPSNVFFPADSAANLGASGPRLSCGNTNRVGSSTCIPDGLSSPRTYQYCICNNVDPLAARVGAASDSSTNAGSTQASTGSQSSTAGPSPAPRFVTECAGGSTSPAAATGRTTADRPFWRQPWFKTAGIFGGIALFGFFMYRWTQRSYKSMFSLTPTSGTLLAPPPSTPATNPVIRTTPTLR